jgi:choline dehydrogenase
MTRKNAADVIVIGSGAGGSVVAGRLVQAGRTVIVLEAGGGDANPVYRVPVMTGMLNHSKYATWGYLSEPQPSLDGRQVALPQGKVVGGSSSINGMLWLRGRPSDYDHWAETGLPGWEWDRICPVFDAIERHSGGSPQRGTAGAIPLNRAPAANPLYQAYFQAGREAGYPLTDDLNAPPFEGIAPLDANIADGSRWSAARAYLDPARGPNLRVVTRAHANRLIIENGIARGVVANVRGRETTFYADEIVVCAGAIATPKLLLLSGIGAADELKAMGISVAADLPGVGRNFHDHVGLGQKYTSREPIGMESLMRLDTAILAFIEAVLFGAGRAAETPFSAGAILRSLPELPEPDIESVFVLTLGPPKLRLPFIDSGRPHGFSVASYQLRPESRGWVKLRSTDPADLPRLQPNYFLTQNDRDTARRGLKITREIIAQPGFDRLRGDEVAPGKTIRTDAELDAWMNANCGTCFHPVGTAKMGPDSDREAVVDGELRVRGIAGLRVADASVMPRITSGNTHAPSIMIGYRCADFMTAR